MISFLHIRGKYYIGDICADDFKWIRVLINNQQ